MSQTLDHPPSSKYKFFSFFKKKEIICSNCLGSGHYARMCFKPIRSFGILCFIKQPETQVCCIQRRHSTALLDFLTGHYDPTNTEMVKCYLSQMTLNERNCLLTNDFKTTWDMFIGQRKFKFEFRQAKENFDKLDIHDLINSTVCEYPDERFGFPKGRRKITENVVDCAVREFEEETGYAKTDIQLLGLDIKVCETVRAINGKIYEQTYWIAEFIGDPSNRIIDDDNAEVKSLVWANSDLVQTLPFEDTGVKFSTLNKISKIIDWRF